MRTSRGYRSILVGVSSGVALGAGFGICWGRWLPGDHERAMASAILFVPLVALVDAGWVGAALGPRARRGRALTSVAAALALAASYWIPGP